MNRRIAGMSYALSLVVLWGLAAGRSLAEEANAEQAPPPRPGVPTLAPPPDGHMAQPALPDGPTADGPTPGGPVTDGPSVGGPEMSTCPCTCSGQCGGIVAGAEATYLKPTVHGGDQTFVGLGRSDALDQQVRFHELAGAPRIWLGWEGDSGRGLRFRYWRYDTSAEGGSYAFNPGMVPALYSSAAALDLRAETIDLEVTRRVELGAWDVLGSFGPRYANLQVDNLFDVNADTIGAHMLSTRRIDGTGLTGALEGYRPMGEYGLGFMANLRGSMLWGPNTGRSTAILNTPGATFAQVAGDNENTTTWIVETQIGLKWTHPVECFRSNVFAHLAFEYQRWTADPVGYSFLQGGGGAGIAGHGLGTDTEFAGLAFAIGFTR